jgi:prepilin signal peptidase PulO-like enzyme (type II secretory pathway)
MKSTWLRKHRLEAGLSVIFLLIGFLIGLAFRFSLPFQLQFEDKVNAIDVLSIVCTVILAWIVATVLDKQKHAENTSKEIIVRRLEELYAFISDTAAKSTEPKFPLTSATSSTKRINVTLSSVYNLLESIGSPANEDLKTKIEHQVIKLNELMTSSPVDDGTGVQLAVRVENGILNFNQARKLEIEAGFESLKNYIISLEIEVNRA